VTVQLESVQHTTSVARDIGSESTWSQLVNLPVSVQQAATGKLRLEVWDDGENGEHIAVGVAELPLSSMTPVVVGPETQEECDAAQAECEPMMVTLCSPQTLDSDFYRGQLQLRVRLVLSEAATKVGWLVGMV